ncbi:CFEM domain-containing protein [Colletotrichum sojae]|uniref:CFEM domain-containing protein n=1 Tax=Colletotrichum sojae TaxID=2175907 RepID=A0A8H6IWZ6_9PEZI|nr:CFEM domain-containing protein [Colletotrichum sojae]
MKNRIGLLLAFTYGASIVAGATPDISKYPTCAVSCIIKALPQSPCTGMNQTCLCADPVFNDDVAACLKTGCTVREQLNTANLTWADCGFPLTDNANLPRFLTGFLFVLPAVFIVIRMMNKWVNPSSWAGDDISILLAFACATAFVPINFRALSLGLGKDIWTLQPDTITEFLKNMFVTQIFYISSLCLIKASIIFFYLRIFPSARFRLVLWATQGFNTSITVLYLILTFTQCDPLPLYWTDWDGQQAGACRDFNKLVLTHVGFNMFLDVWMLALPLTQLYKLNIRLRKKIGVILMFSVGIFLTAVSAIRIQTVVHFATTNNITCKRANQ